MTTRSTQDRLIEAETAYKLVLHTIFYMESVAKIWRDSPGGLSELPQLNQTLDGLHDRLGKLKATVCALKDHIEAEVEPEEDQAPISATEDFAPEKAKVSREGLERLMRAIYAHFPEPPLTGGQLVNRIIDNTADNLPVYITGEDLDGNEALTPITGFDVHEGKIILA